MKKEAKNEQIVKDLLTVVNRLIMEELDMNIIKKYVKVGNILYSIIKIEEK